MGVPVFKRRKKSKLTVFVNLIRDKELKNEKHATNLLIMLILHLIRSSMRVCLDGRSRGNLIRKEDELHFWKFEKLKKIWAITNWKCELSHRTFKTILFDSKVPNRGYYSGSLSEIPQTFLALIC